MEIGQEQSVAFKSTAWATPEGTGEDEMCFRTKG